MVKIIRLDDEKTIIKLFEAWTARQEITVERSSLDTPAQNGIAEQSGGVIIRKDTRYENCRSITRESMARA